MATFSYKARQANGTLTKGTLRAANEERAGSLLRSHDLTPVSIEEVKEGSVLNKTIGNFGVNMRDLIMFFREGASMINAGVPILETLQALQKQVRKQSFASVIQEIIYDIEAGESLSISMSKHPAVFNQFVLGIIRTGEASGKLGSSLTAIANQLEEEYGFQRSVRAALIYPIFVLVLVVILIVVMFTFVLPQLVTLFDDAHVQLPLVTRMLIAITHFLTSYWIILLTVAIALGFLLRSWLRTTEGRYTFSTWTLQIPVLKEIIQKVYLARMTSILATLFASDVPIIEALGLARESIGNRVYQRILDDTIQAVKSGSAISYVWEHEPHIPAMLTTMVNVGERSGRVSDAFTQANKFFARDVAEVLESVTILLEPILIVILGIGVGVVVGSVLLPIYNLVLVIS
ncbi:MAG: type II secretion system F family protein [Candidatus Andersenbacteria bacterium]|nr:type II secretion system F family protein [Candidatus Andersenbacteria bacterium]